jgi:TonB family protein
MIIDEEGKVNDISIAQSTSPELNAEAIRLAMAMPRWRPARQNNKSVAVSYILPIRFDLE